MEYTVTSARKDEECHDCGGVATIVLVALYSDRETGYRDEVPLCEDCAEKRQV